MARRPARVGPMALEPLTVLSTALWTSVSRMAWPTRPSRSRSRATGSARSTSLPGWVSRSARGRPSLRRGSRRPTGPSRLPSRLPPRGASHASWQDDGPAPSCGVDDADLDHACRLLLIEVLARSVRRCPGPTGGDHSRARVVQRYLVSRSGMAATSTQMSGWTRPAGTDPSIDCSDTSSNTVARSSPGQGVETSNGAA